MQHIHAGKIKPTQRVAVMEPKHVQPGCGCPMLGPPGPCSWLSLLTFLRLIHLPKNNPRTHSIPEVLELSKGQPQERTEHSRKLLSKIDKSFSSPPSMSHFICLLAVPVATPARHESDIILRIFRDALCRSWTTGVKAAAW